ncbi:MAG: sulfotransferase [Deltaproteobacteria bacterium]|nr:sulfotransferase [Deltaproteobacteria bacterium]
MHGEEKRVVVVSGLPRSGTSMMMRVLAAGGVPLVTDGLREADEDNPHGYFELEAVKSGQADNSWLEGSEGKAVKVVSALLPELPSSCRYRIIFMDRDVDEVVTSQRVMLARQGKEPEVSDPEMAALFRRHLEEVTEWLAGRDDMAVERIPYKAMVATPAEQVSRIVAFLGLRLDEEAMVRAVDPGLYRQKGGEVRPQEAGAEGAEPTTTSEDERKLIEAQLAALGYM